ncbi:hypothetical protein [Sedimenticola hydrogenitrophicus]|uniref:hypothetical protein n=1 Tax=Sedimenticola hydrogenitrophicus TaxID=2967975 RepID=UPI0021A6AB35|nr:hypothetical protein [Sedimenticola hydrogenitrophicus]
MRLKTLILIPVGIGLLAYAAVKGVLYYQVKSELDRLASQVAPVARLTYDGIASSLRGGVAVNGVTLTPAGAPAGIRIERVDLRGDGPGFLLDLLGGFDPQRPPPRLRLAISRMGIPLGSDYLQGWSPGAATTPDLCSLGGLLGQTEIERLGFRQRLADAQLRYDHDRRAGELTLGLEFTLDGLAGLSLEMVLGNLPGNLLGPGVESPPTLRRFSLHYHMDPDYMRRAVDYCAGQAGLQPAAFVDGLFSRGADYFASNLGFIPGADLQAALHRLISRPGELLITAVPDSRFNPARLQQYTAAELVRLLGINLSVNDQPVTDLSFRLAQGDAALSPLFGDNAPQTAVVPGEGAAPSAAAPKKPRARYIATPLAQLPRYLGREARIFGADRVEPQQGIMMALRDQQLELEQRMHGGKMTLYIPLGKIRRAEVLRRE